MADSSSGSQSYGDKIREFFGMEVDAGKHRGKRGKQIEAALEKAAGPKKKKKKAKGY